MGLGNSWTSVTITVSFFLRVPRVQLLPASTREGGGWAGSARESAPGVSHCRACNVVGCAAIIENSARAAHVLPRLPSIHLSLSTALFFCVTKRIVGDQWATRRGPTVVLWAGTGARAGLLQFLPHPMHRRARQLPGWMPGASRHLPASFLVELPGS